MGTTGDHMHGICMHEDYMYRHCMYGDHMGGFDLIKKQTNANQR